MRWPLVLQKCPAVPSNKVGLSSPGRFAISAEPSRSVSHQQPSERDPAPLDTRTHTHTHTHAHAHAHARARARARTCTRTHLQCAGPKLPKLRTRCGEPKGLKASPLWRYASHEHMHGTVCGPLGWDSPTVRPRLPVPPGDVRGVYMWKRTDASASSCRRGAHWPRTIGAAGVWLAVGSSRCP